MLPRLLDWIYSLNDVSLRIKLESRVSYEKKFFIPSHFHLTVRFHHKNQRKRNLLACRMSWFLVLLKPETECFFLSLKFVQKLPFLLNSYLDLWCLLVKAFMIGGHCWRWIYSNMIIISYEQACWDHDIKGIINSPFDIFLILFTFLNIMEQLHLDATAWDSWYYSQ